MDRSSYSTIKTKEAEVKRRNARRPALVGGLSCVVFCVFLAGCAPGAKPGPHRSDVAAQAPGPVGAGPERICLADVQKAAAMQVAEGVLAKMHFTIEKADAEAGLIRTRPLSGAQFFEFWRTDSVGGFNSTEANLHSIRRTVELRFGKKEEGLCIDCDVKTERLNLPEQEVTSSARAYELFSKSRSSLQSMHLNPAQETGIAWVDLGKDRGLALEVLGRIQKQISKLLVGNFYQKIISIPKEFVWFLLELFSQNLYMLDPFLQ